MLPGIPTPVETEAAAESSDASRVDVTTDVGATGLELCVLGSGSGGNATVVRTPTGMMLLDAGLGPVTIAKRLTQARQLVAGIRAIVLTHLDQDHFRPTWIPTLAGFRIPLYVHQWHEANLRRIEGISELYTADLVRQFDNAALEPLPGLTLTPLHLRHDAQGTCGFAAHSPWGRFGFATDLGCVPSTLIDAFAGVDLLAIESNYDPQMQIASNRPIFLKRRIMGEAGHLSNQQAFDAVRAIARASPSGLPRDIVLLHRSSQCNTTDKIDEAFAGEPALLRRVTHTHQRRRTRWFRVQPAPAATRRQMLLPF
ncbi:MAG: MBL fold metallo-hydrolase [Phycisphaeraceae bacterium]|nr:MBL fold metallo-hydrolase [Phycisphaeraceae bacterium]